MIKIHPLNNLYYYNGKLLSLEEIKLIHGGHEIVEMTVDELIEIKTLSSAKADQDTKVLEKYAKHLAKMIPKYYDYSVKGKNGANSDNEKGFWRGMQSSVESFLNDMYNHGLIEHRGIFGDPWPEEEKDNEKAK